MVFRITLEPAGKTFESADGESILDAALRAGIGLPYGCRDGLCGACRGKVLSGEISHEGTSINALGEAERAQGLALFCCAQARSDVRIEGREAQPAGAIPARTLPVRVEILERLAPDVMLLELKLPGSEEFNYFAGQYIDILVGGGRRRAFSLAGAPGAGTLQLHIRRVPGGEFTGRVFDSLKVRDLLRIHGPHGSFFLREDSPKPIILVARGTGFAPIKAMVEAALARGEPRPIHLYWGGKQRRDLYLDGLANAWAAAHPSIHYVPVLSAPVDDDDWHGRRGVVSEAVIEDFPDLSGYQVYACGSPRMVASARRDFVERCALPESEFFADAFEYSNDPTRQGVGASAVEGVR